MDGLFFEEIFESLASIHWLGCSGSRGLFLAGHTNREKRALVLRVLSSDAHWYGLQAFEVARRVEIHALLAGVQFESALRTFFRHLPESRKKRAALGAAGHVARAGHLQWPRPERVFFYGLLERLFLGGRSAVLVASLPVLSI